LYGCFEVSIFRPQSIRLFKPWQVTDFALFTLERYQRPPRLLRGALPKSSDLLEVTRGVLRFAGGSENGFLVILQNSEPIFDIRGVIDAWFRLNSQIGAYETGSKLSDQFFHAVPFIAEAAREIAVETRRSPGPMTKLMGLRTYIPFGRFELSKRRHLDEIARWGIERAISAVLDHSRKTREEAIRAFNLSTRTDSGNSTAVLAV
jgi:hypothetical protein